MSKLDMPGRKEDESGSPYEIVESLREFGKFTEEQLGFILRTGMKNPSSKLWIKVCEFYKFFHFGQKTEEKYAQAKTMVDQLLKYL